MTRRKVQTMAGTVSDVLRIAASQVGYSRWNDPQQGTKYGRWYAQQTGNAYFGLSGVPYCAMFVSWVLAQANVKCPCFPSAVAFDKRNSFAGRYVDKNDLRAGDVISFDWDGDNGGDHVGFVEKVYTDHVQTIEGNTGDGVVARRTRYYSSIICGVRPYYAQEASTGGALDVDGYIGPKSVREWQRQCGTTVDGVISGQSTYDKQYQIRLASVTYDGGGSELVRAVQRKVGAYVDGYMGKGTIKGVQRFVGVAQDGYFGPETAKALQRSLNEKKWRG